MAVMDTRTMFCENQAVNAAAGTALIGSQIDLVNARDIGNGTPLWWNIVVDAAFTSGGAATVNVQLVSDAQVAIAVDGSATKHLETGVLGFAQFPANKQWGIALPIEGNVYERFLGVIITTAVATTTAGSITSFLSLAPYKWKAFTEAAS